MDQFLKELYEGHVDLHDAWQVELETTLSDASSIPLESCSQEFYFFLPASLQISPETYSKEDFYEDRTNFVRKKTPDIPIARLVERRGGKHSFVFLFLAKAFPGRESMQERLLLIANIFRTSLRHQTHLCYKLYRDMVSEEGNSFHQSAFTASLEELSKNLEDFLALWHDEIVTSIGKICQDSQLKHILTTTRRYISTSIDSYLSGLLLQFDAQKTREITSSLSQIKKILESEKRYRIEHFQEPESLFSTSEEEKENILHDRSRCERLVRSVLFLPLKKRSIFQAWNNLVASVAAGFAAFIYLLILFWNTSGVVANSMTFVLLSSVLYIFRDRIKEIVKNIFQRKAEHFFDDFRTDIFSAESTISPPLGIIREYFVFLVREALPKEIAAIKQWASGGLYEPQLAPILYYRKHIQQRPSALYRWFSAKSELGDHLHTIFRWNVRSIFEKASDPYEEISTFDILEGRPYRIRLPKVYQVHLIIKTIKTTRKENDRLEEESQYQKYRVFVDKSGIRRVLCLYDGAHPPT